MKEPSAARRAEGEPGRRAGCGRTGVAARKSPQLHAQGAGLQGRVLSQGHVMSSWRPTGDTRLHLTPLHPSPPHPDLAHPAPPRPPISIASTFLRPAAPTPPRAGPPTDLERLPVVGQRVQQADGAAGVADGLLHVIDGGGCLLALASCKSIARDTRQAEFRAADVFDSCSSRGEVPSMPGHLQWYLKGELGAQVVRLGGVAWLSQASVHDLCIDPRNHSWPRYSSNTLTPPRYSSNTLTPSQQQHATMGHTAKGWAVPTCFRRLYLRLLCRARWVGPAQVCSRRVRTGRQQ